VADCQWGSEIEASPNLPIIRDKLSGGGRLRKDIIGVIKLKIK
jgi:hypothetical protein